MDIKKLIVTTDLSNVSTSVFDMAAYEAKMKGAEIDLVHVMNPPTQYYPTDIEMGYEGILADYREQEKEAVMNKLQEFAKTKFHGASVKISLLDGQGSEGELIAKHGKETGADAIMLASAGRGFLGQMFVGSTVLRLLQHAECPVIVAPVQVSE